jgi:hypothetical protein
MIYWQVESNWICGFCEPFDNLRRLLDKLFETPRFKNENRFLIDSLAIEVGWREIGGTPMSRDGCDNDRRVRESPVQLGLQRPVRRAKLSRRYGGQRLGKETSRTEKHTRYVGTSESNHDWEASCRLMNCSNGRG